jgi:hypothetical protein
MRSWRIGVLALLVAATLAPTTAIAQSAPQGAEDAVEAEAKKAFDLGSKLYAEGAAREALAAFEQSYRALPRVSSLQNAAQCLRDLKQFARAFAAYDELITKFGPAMKADKLEAAKTARDELARVTGTLRITIAEAGARVAIDDAESGVTPLTSPIRVNVGQHTIVITKPDFKAIRRVVEVHGGDEINVSDPLERDLGGVDSRARVVVTTSDPSASIVLDGTLVGHGSWESVVAAGQHVLVVSRPGAPTEQRRFDAKSGANVRLDIALDPGGRAAKKREAERASQRTLGFVALGGGGLGLALGAITGLLVLGKHSDLSNRCPSGVCYGDAARDLSGYHALGTVSTIAFVAGGVLGAGGVVLLATAPSERKGDAEAKLSVGPTGLFAKGSF